MPLTTTLLTRNPPNLEYKATAEDGSAVAGAGFQEATTISDEALMRMGEVRHANLERRAAQEAAALLRALAPGNASAEAMFEICVAPANPYVRLHASCIMVCRSLPLWLRCQMPNDVRALTANHPRPKLLPPISGHLQREEPQDKIHGL
jgi:hypothetical protein